MSKQNKEPLKTGKNAPRQRDFGDRETIKKNWMVYTDQVEAIKGFAVENTKGNVQLAVRNIFDEKFGLPKEKE